MNPESVVSASKLVDSIIESAAKRFLLYGFRKTTVDEIARDLHISKKTLYMVFASKDAILREVAWRDVTEIVRKFNETLPVGLASERIIVEFCRAIFADRTKMGTTGRFRGLFSEDGDIGAAYRASVARILSALYRDGMTRGSCKPAEPDLAADLVISMVLTAAGTFHTYARPAAVFTLTLDMIADAIAWTNRLQYDAKA
jgi:AcrR family transcriptional regulator